MKKQFASFVMALSILLVLPIGSFANETETTVDPRVEVLNSIQLSPQSVGSPQLDDYLDTLLPTIINDEMDTYTKLSACYNYIIQNTTYANHLNYLNTSVGDTTCRSIYNQYGEVEGYGAVALLSHKGMCNAYSSAWMLMAKKIGVPSRLVEGKTRASRGGYTYHKWAEVDIGDTTYVFDPQVDQSLSRYKGTNFTLFGRTYAEIPGRYLRY